MTTSDYVPDDAQGGREGHPMDTIDIIQTPEACRQIAQLFRAQRADVETLAVRAAQALDALDALDDDARAHWDRSLLAAAFEVLYEDERTRVRHIADRPAARPPGPLDDPARRHRDRGASGQRPAGGRLSAPHSLLHQRGPRRHRRGPGARASTGCVTRNEDHGEPASEVSHHQPGSIRR